MKTINIVLTLFLAVTTTLSAQEPVASSKEETQKIVYACPMHPKEMSMEKGKNCTICGMAMEETSQNKNSSGKNDKYVCTMDGMTSNEPGKCSKCGMEMVKVIEKKRNFTVKGSQSNTEIVTKYVCKMDGQTSDKSGKCPKCGMVMKETNVKQENHKQ
jgi:hypothetical protein